MARLCGPKILLLWTGIIGLAYCKSDFIRCCFNPLTCTHYHKFELIYSSQPNFHLLNSTHHGNSCRGFRHACSCQHTFTHLVNPSLKHFNSDHSNYCI
eukprot:superscaffoldBa00004501_g18990